MLPALTEGRLIIGSSLGKLRTGDMVILAHDGIEKIKRVHHIDGEKLYVRGDNAAASTDSRHFGWIDRTQIIARVVWPKVSFGDLR